MLLWTNFLQNVDLGFFTSYNNCQPGQIVCKFCKLGFPDKFTRWSRWPGRSGWAFYWFYVIFYVTFLIENFSEFDFHLTRERGTRRSPWNSRPGTLPSFPVSTFYVGKLFHFVHFHFFGLQGLLVLPKTNLPAPTPQKSRLNLLPHIKEKEMWSLRLVYSISLGPWKPKYRLSEI